MSEAGTRQGRSIIWRVLVVFVLIFGLSSWSGVSAQIDSDPVWIVRTLQTGEFGVDAPTGLAYSAPSDAFLIWGQNDQISVVSMQEEFLASLRMDETIGDPINIAFDDSTSSLIGLDGDKVERIGLILDNGGLTPRAAGAEALNLSAFHLHEPQGITVDPDSGRLFLLEPKAKRITVLDPGMVSGLENATGRQEINIQTLTLSLKNSEQLRGIAFNPQNRHLVVANPVRKELYELNESGQIVSTYDVRSLDLQHSSTLLFAPSVDRTDDPANMNLFLLDEGKSSASGGQVVEVSLAAPAALPAGTPLLPATLVRTVDVSKNAWNPSSPDPSGIDYWPATGRFLITDSEVEEMGLYWAGANVFDATTAGSLVSTCNSTSFSREPTGVAINPNTNRIYISDDDGGKLFEVSLGPDGVFCTGDDTRSVVRISTDLEDVAYGNNTIFLAGGTDAEVWMFNLGPNGVLGGGDDGPLTHFDTASKGFRDVEGIGYNPDAGTLFIVSAQGNEAYLGEMSVFGMLLRAYDLSFMGNRPNIRSDVTYAPSSQNPAVKNIYIVSRGVDNNQDRQENDGKWWEISLSSLPTPIPTTPVPTPTVTATPIAGSTWQIQGQGNFVFGEAGDIPVPGDYNGDGRADIAVFHPSNGTWYISGVGNFVFGEAGDIPVPGDYNGDGRADIAVYRPSNGTWYIYGVGRFVFGVSSDIPVPGDYNGDGRADIAVYRPSNGTWYIYGVGRFVFGVSSDIPVPGDYNGDGATDIAVFRASNSTWYTVSAGTFQFGTANDVPVVDDYTGDGREEVAVYRPSNSTWYIYGVGAFAFGTSNGKPVVEDYTGDGIADLAVFRP